MTTITAGRAEVLIHVTVDIDTKILTRVIAVIHATWPAGKIIDHLFVLVSISLIFLRRTVVGIIVHFESIGWDSFYGGLRVIVEVECSVKVHFSIVFAI